MPIYQIAGLTWVSDFKFPLLIEQKKILGDSVQLIKAPTGVRYSSPPVSSTGKLMDGENVIAASYQLENGTYLLRWRYFDFLIDNQGKSVVCYSDGDAPDLEVWELLSDWVSPFVLMLWDMLAIHASSVVINQTAVCFVGFSGSGKSTTATALAHAGAGWLTDDTAIISQLNGNYFVHSSHPIVNLCKDAAEHFQLHQNSTIKVEVPLTKVGIRPTNGIYDLHTIYSLHCHPGKLRPAIKQIDGISKIVKLLPHVRAIALAPPSLRSYLFTYCHQLAQTVRFVEFHYPSGLDKLQEICDFLINDMQNKHPLFPASLSNKYE